MPIGILKFTHARWSPPSGCQLWLPLREMSIGRSANLITWNPINPTAGWIQSNLSTLDDSSTPTPIPSGNPKCMRLIASGAGNPITYNTSISYQKYFGITVLIEAYCYAENANVGDTSVIRIKDSVSGTNSTAISKGAGWLYKSASQKQAYNSTYLYPYGWIDYSGYTAGDTLYIDNLRVTVPQMKERSPLGGLVHPDGPSGVSIYNSGQGFYFDGVDDLIACESDLIGTGNISLACWLNPHAMPTSTGIANGLIIAGNVKFILALVKIDASNFAFMLTSDGGTTSITSASIATTQLDKWLYLAITRPSGGNSAQIYVNAVASGASGNTGTPAAGTSNLIIGNRVSDVARGYSGTIDDLPLYNRLISLGEIKNHYNMTKGYH